MMKIAFSLATRYKVTYCVIAIYYTRYLLLYLSIIPCFHVYIELIVIITLFSFLASSVFKGFQCK